MILSFFLCNRKKKKHQTQRTKTIKNCKNTPLLGFYRSRGRVEKWRQLAFQAVRMSRPGISSRHELRNAINQRAINNRPL